MFSWYDTLMPLLTAPRRHKKSTIYTKLKWIELITAQNSLVHDGGGGQI
jgi:hypothetical protein